MSEVELLDGEVVEIVDVQEVGRPTPEQFGYIPKDNPEEEEPEDEDTDETQPESSFEM